MVKLMLPGNYECDVNMDERVSRAELYQSIFGQCAVPFMRKKPVPGWIEVLEVARTELMKQIVYMEVEHNMTLETEKIWNECQNHLNFIKDKPGL